LLPHAIFAITATSLPSITQSSLRMIFTRQVSFLLPLFFLFNMPQSLVLWPASVCHATFLLVPLLLSQILPSVPLSWPAHVAASKEKTGCVLRSNSALYLSNSYAQKLSMPSSFFFLPKFLSMQQQHSYFVPWCFASAFVCIMLSWMHTMYLYHHHMDSC